MAQEPLLTTLLDLDSALLQDFFQSRHHRTAEKENASQCYLNDSRLLRLLPTVEHLNVLFQIFKRLEW